MRIRSIAADRARAQAAPPRENNVVTVGFAALALVAAIIGSWLMIAALLWVATIALLVFDLTAGRLENLW